jgi:hypothetical protein
MSTSLSRSLPWLISAALAVYGAVQTIDARNARRAARAEVLRADSLAAVQDSLRVVLADHAGRVWWWQQRAIQGDIERDRLAAELDQERKATVRLRLELDTLRVRSAAPVAVVDTLRDIRRATFAERLRYGAQEFGALFAHVVMPAPPAQATLEAEVALDSVVIVPEVRCGAPGPAGIGPALVALRTPAWIQARADSAVVDPDVCNPLPRETPRPQLLGLPLPKVEELIAALAGAAAWEIVR